MKKMMQKCVRTPPPVQKHVFSVRVMCAASARPKQINKQNYMSIVAGSSVCLLPFRTFGDPERPFLHCECGPRRGVPKVHYEHQKFLLVGPFFRLRSAFQEFLHLLGSTSNMVSSIKSSLTTLSDVSLFSPRESTWRFW